MDANQTKAEANSQAKEELSDASKALYEASKDSVVNIVASHFHKGKQVMGSAGSGFFADIAGAKDKASCRLLTDNHVISLYPELTVTLEVQLDDGSKYPGKVIKQVPSHDLAVIELEGVKDPQKQCPALKLADKEAAPGDTVLRLNRTRWESEAYQGKYLGMEKRRDQQLPELEGENKDRDLMVFDIYNNLGQQFSGGPFLNKEGEVIAINEGAQGSRKGLATPAADIIKQLESLPKP